MQTWHSPTTWPPPVHPMVVHTWQLGGLPLTLVTLSDTRPLLWLLMTNGGNSPASLTDILQLNGSGVSNEAYGNIVKFKLGHLCTCLWLAPSHTPITGTSSSEKLSWLRAAPWGLRYIAPWRWMVLKLQASQTHTEPKMCPWRLMWSPMWTPSLWGSSWLLPTHPSWEPPWLTFCMPRSLPLGLGGLLFLQANMGPPPGRLGQMQLHSHSACGEVYGCRPVWLRLQEIGVVRRWPVSNMNTYMYHMEAAMAVQPSQTNVSVALTRSPLCRFFDHCGLAPSNPLNGTSGRITGSRGGGESEQLGCVFGGIFV